jgi:hypothetical protein
MSSSDRHKKILYILTYRARNQYRIKNLGIVLQWLETVKNHLNKVDYKIQFDILIVEQDKETRINGVSDQVKTLFVQNNEPFNKGWSFNVIFKKYQDYDYYICSDADIIIPNVSLFCEEIKVHCVDEPKMAYRPFKKRMDMSVNDIKKCHSYSDIVSFAESSQLHLTEHHGLSFAGNLICLSNKMYSIIGGWEEQFSGWGRSDDFLSHKLDHIGLCEQIVGTTEAIHLWHPVTSDFSLKPNTIQLYDKLTSYDDIQLLEIVNKTKESIGNPNKYSNK